MEKWYVIDYEQILCPICVNHIFGRWIINAMTPTSQKFIPTEIGIKDERVKALGRFYNGEYFVPTMLVLKETVFMNRKTFESKFLVVGAYDDLATYIYKKTLLNVVEV